MKSATEDIVKAALVADGEVSSEQAARGLLAFRGDPSPPPLLSMDEVANRFGCTVRTVQRWISEGELKPIRRGRLVRIPENQLYGMES